MPFSGTWAGSALPFLVTPHSAFCVLSILDGKILSKREASKREQPMSSFFSPVQILYHLLVVTTSSCVYVLVPAPTDPPPLRLDHTAGGCRPRLRTDAKIRHHRILTARLPSFANAFQLLPSLQLSKRGSQCSLACCALSPPRPRGEKTIELEASGTNGGLTWTGLELMLPRLFRVTRHPSDTPGSGM